MFQFVGYNFFSDGDALNYTQTNVEAITETTVSNAIFDHLNVSSYSDIPFSTAIPEDWDHTTILNVDFDGNINAGNIDFVVNQISAVKIKRRPVGTFDWITLNLIPVNNVQDLNFVFNDFLNAYGVNYEYALVPIINDVEGDYITNEIFSRFNGVFIGDNEQIFKFLYDVNYGTNARNQQVGVFTPLGQQYPIIVANGLLSYESGTVSAMILNDDYEDTGVIDPQAIVQKKTILKDFLTNKKAKLLKDWNSNVWLCMVTNSPQVTYAQGSSMAIPKVSFDWTQIGDATSQAALYNNGLVNSPN